MKTTKTCRKCEREIDITDFNVCNANLDKLSSYCKECSKQYGKSHYKSNKSNRLKQIKQWRGNNAKKVKQYNDNRKPAN